MNQLEILVQRAQTIGRAVLARVGWAAPLLARVALGTVFIGTGWGKLNDLDKVTSFFTDLGIPAPHLNAIMAALTEFVCGSLLVAGLATRFASLPLVVVMTVAIATAKRGDISGVTDLFGLEEFTYITIFLWLAAAGAGPASVDGLIARWWKNRHRSPTTTTPSDLIPSNPLRA
jgi:putative oxidoreductase